MGSVPVVAPDRLAAFTGDPDVPPVVGVDLSGPGRDVAVRHGDRVLVGIGPVHPDRAGLARALDLTLVDGAAARRFEIGVGDPESALAGLADVAYRVPRAATILAGLLRWSGDLPVEAALDAESFAYSTLLGGPEFARWLESRGPRPAPPEAPDPVLVVRDDGVLRVTLHRPERRNAYGRQVRDALVDALDVAVSDPSVEHVVLDGAGPGFCSGGDLDEFGTTPDPVTAHLVRTRAGAARRLDVLAGRTTVHLHGACVGAGIELAAFAGHVVADPGTTVRLPEVGMGLIPGAGGTVSLPRRIGRWRALYLALSGFAVDARTALGWGLVDELA
ncbi:enoyl-CoA hydratase/isomerase family protein [Pseudonocardia endophytica]|uniref:Enoyl-CoA hydratase/carnithine racemase n=1 Tax=Pseudonocardia endophytica TaxID=401976 RepID=A0A4R1HIE0_PSEEN|nr:enoyl-CoA hydratase/isomerase family protein [Pseudonocardia endophytica]TCK22017.1 enoyl-CoA hydratase/carnithine racemase [Pseudonocardia endophytica]